MLSVRCLSGEYLLSRRILDGLPPQTQGQSRRAGLRLGTRRSPVRRIAPAVEYFPWPSPIQPIGLRDDASQLSLAARLAAQTHRSYARHAQGLHAPLCGPLSRCLPNSSSCGRPNTPQGASVRRMDLDAVRAEINSQVQRLRAGRKQPALVKLGRLQTAAWRQNYPNLDIIEWWDDEMKMRQLHVEEVEDENLVFLVASPY